MSGPLVDHAIYAGLWLSFGLLHSLLAHEPLRRPWKAAFGHAARLAYNALALLHIVAVLAAGRVWLFDDPAFTLPWWTLLVQVPMVLAAAWLFAVASRSYDMNRFLGVEQIRHGTPDRPEEEADPAGRDSEDEEPLHTGGLHGVIRHPFYTAGMLLFWGLARDDGGIATALWGTLYFMVGARCEEHRLIRLFGERYRSYRRQVPAYFPRPWR